MKKGMTLIELLIAALITSIGVSGMMMSFVACKEIIDRNTKKLNSTILVSQLFEGLQRRDDELTAKQFIDTDHPSGSYMSPADDERYYLKWEVAHILNPSDDSDIALVTLRISWDLEYIEDDTNNSISMQMITNEPN